MNMGVEQYVYHRLKKPFVDIVGEVGSNLYDNYYGWINMSKNKNEMEAIGKTRLRVLLKGS
jgi:hypothetical protein